MQWRPDLTFYQRYAPIPNYKKQKAELTFISNGKTHSLVSVAEETQCETIIVSNKNSIPSNYNSSQKYVHIFHQEAPDDTKMVKLLNDCSVLVVPTPKTKNRLGSIGLTSFVDAIALGMPIIASDNTVFSDIVSKHKMGIIYEAGNEKELANAMSLFKDNPELVTEYGENAFKFGEKHNMIEFGENIYNLFK